MILSVDDGCASDVRVADLAAKYEIETIFYWPVEWHSLAYYKEYEPLSFDNAWDIARNYEIGSHTITHRHLTSLDEAEADYEIVTSKDMLELMFATEVTKFCPPRGYTNPALTKLALTFYESQRLTRGPGLVHIHPDSGANDNKPWRDCIDDDTTELWGHSWEFDKYDLWGEVEGVLRDISSQQ